MKTSTRSLCSLWSTDSFLSIGCTGSALSIGSVGSFLSIGSVGSFASVGSAGSAFSLASALSWLSVGFRPLRPLRGGRARLAEQGAWGVRPAVAVLGLAVPTATLRTGRRR